MVLTSVANSMDIMLYAKKGGYGINELRWPDIGYNSVGLFSATPATINVFGWVREQPLDEVSIKHGS